MDLNRLRILRAVAASGSVNAAAVNLGYTPSTLSQHLAVLQKETKLTLLQRSGRGVRITPAGRALVAESDDVFAALARLDQFAEQLREGKTGSIEISTFSSAAQVWLPSIVIDVCGRFPDVSTHIRPPDSRPNDSETWADIRIRTEDPAQLPNSHNDFDRIVLTEEPYHLIGRADMFETPLTPRSMHSLRDTPLIANTEDGVVCGDIVARCCTSAGFTPQWAARASDHHTALALAYAGVGATILPALASIHMPSGLVAVELIEPQPRRRIVADVRTSSTTKPAVMTIVELLLAAGTEAREDPPPAFAEPATSMNLTRPSIGSAHG